MKTKIMSNFGLIISYLALFAASIAVSKACFWFFYQPETPDKELITQMKKDRGI